MMKGKLTMHRRTFLTAIGAALALPVAAKAEQIEKWAPQKKHMPKAIRAATDTFSKNAPSALSIEKSLSAPTIKRIKPSQKNSIQEIKRRKSLRHNAPSIEIQSLNFAFASARIPDGELWKVEQIADAMKRILRRNRGELFLIEGHTDAVGSDWNNMLLSEQRANSLRAVLVGYYGVPHHALETVGYGEEDLLVPTPYEEWRNRRVTLRRITDIAYR
tara:strand:- start:206716 stop:207366 length:651 start_codon:yes stop_codon:yes gene_type:complete